MTTLDAMTAPGFANPVRDAAHAFRAILDAMARPGRLRSLPAVAPPAPLSPAAAAVVLTLCDGDAPLWLAPALRNEGVEAWARFHTGAPPVADLAAARFALGRWAALRGASDLPTGAPDRPDLSVTLVIEAPGLAAGAGPRLSGPGAPDGPRIGAPDLDAAFWAMVARNADSYPLGLDVILTCGDRVAALPRSVRLDV